MTDDLFANQERKGYRPLADRVRPQHIDEFHGQEHLLAQGKPLRSMLEAGRFHSVIFWGPPGVGKTTLALLVSRYLEAHFISLSAVLSGVKEIRQAIEEARHEKQSGRDTILFIDEVHRFNKSQQDAFLPHVEDGTVIFIGATTENPSFELNGALLSRARVFVLNALSSSKLQEIMKQALQQDGEVSAFQSFFPEDILKQLADFSDGDARRALNLLQLACELLAAQQGEGKKAVIDDEFLSALLSGASRRFDKGGDLFYEQISALHKAVRGSSPDAALYWYARMIDGGCDPLYLARRVLRMASEDIGNADPRALSICLDAWNTYERLGSPEGELAIAQAITYLACAPKSNAVYLASKKAFGFVRENQSFPVPMHLRNAPTQMMKNMDYGKDYQYAHDDESGFITGENYLPEEASDFECYFPVERGMEVKIREKLLYYRNLNAQSKWKRFKNKSS